MGVINIDEIDRTELQVKLRKKIEMRYGSPSKPAWANLVTIIATPSGEPQSKDAPPIYQEEIREVSAKSTASMPQLKMPIPKLIDEMACAMESAAKEMALNQTVQFFIQFYTPGSDRAVSSSYCSLYSEGDEPNGVDGGGGRFAGTEKQDKAQDHRHREQTFRMYRDGNKTVMEFMAEQLKEAQIRIRQQDAFIVTMHAATQQAQSQALQRDLLIKSAAVKEEMLMKAFHSFMGHLPILAQYFTGGGNATINFGSDLRLNALKEVYAGLSLDVKQDLEAKVIDLMSKIEPSSQSIMMQVFADLKKTEAIDKAQLAVKNGGSLPSGYGMGQRSLTEGGFGG